MLSDRMTGLKREGQEGFLLTISQRTYGKVFIYVYTVYRLISLDYV